MKTTERLTFTIIHTDRNMQEKMMKRTLLALTLAALTIGTAAAQDRTRTPDPKVSEARKELIESVKKFALGEILPQLTAWKSQLDGAMSAEDLKALNALRSRATALQSRAIEYGRAMGEAWKSENYEALKANREKMKKLGEEHKALFEELKPLAIKYRSTLEAIGQDARPKVEGWKEQGKEIFQKWVADHKDQLADMKGMHRMIPGGLGWMGHGDKKAMVARFMLWDGSDFISRLEQQMTQPGLGGQGEMDFR
jgi:hypothetical protein